MSFKTTLVLEIALDTWEENKTKDNWDKVLAAGTKHTFTDKETDRYADVNTTLTDSEAIYARLRLPQKKAIELVKHIENT